MKKVLFVIFCTALHFFCKAQDHVLYKGVSNDTINIKDQGFNEWKNNDSTYCYYMHLRDSLSNELSKVKRSRKKREKLEFDIKMNEAIIKLYISSFVTEQKMKSRNFVDTIPSSP